MNFSKTISFRLFSFFAIINGVNCIDQTKIQKSYRSCFSRVKRFVYFPPGSAALVTQVMTKHLIGPHPRGFQMTLELDVLFDLPTNREEWLPPWLKEKRKNVPPKMKQTTSKPSSMKESSERMDVRVKIYGNFDAYENVIGDDGYPVKVVYNPESNYEQWFTYRPHRERRQIFDRIENTARRLGYNSIRECILRSICEVKHLLLPPGKSLIQDIIRIIFEIPTKPHWNDVYSNATRVNATDCRNQYNEKCPVSILELILNNQVDITKL